MVTAYYNEIDPFAAQWLRNLILAGYIAPGEVDERSIRDVSPDDLKGFTQCHFFAGIGGWSLALRQSGWEDDRPVWTGSCPCQPFSVAGKKRGEEDERHLWPEFKRLIASHRPIAIFGEQVAGKNGLQWVDGVARDFAKEDYRFGFVVLEASAFGVPQKRERIYFAADTAVTNAARRSTNVRWDGRSQALETDSWEATPWKQGNADFGYVDDGIPSPMVKNILKGFGNAIVPRVASEFIASYMDVTNAQP